ncbi:MAG: hypothetical protein HXY47_02765 [Nitrospirae bacterium]|nr:hypothetical protein [Nitrospirota bacterium]
MDKFKVRDTKMIGFFIKTVIFIILLSFFPAIALSDIVVYDIVSPVGKEVMLKSEVRGKLFKKGGEVVEFFINGKTIGKSLTGGDGFAFKEFVPVKRGRYRISVKSVKDKGEGLLISISKGSYIVFIDAENCLFVRFSGKLREKSEKIIREIDKRFPVVLLKTSLMNIKTVKEWLKKNSLKDFPLISWDGGIVFSDFVEKGFKIKAVVGSSDVINSAKEYKPIAFSFYNTEDGVYVRNWEDIRKKLIDGTKVKDSY